MSTIDISELVLKVFGMGNQKTRIDVRMGISIVIKLIFFCVWFYVSGENKYEGGHFAITLIVWIIFHLQIIVIEKKYIISGENEIKLRIYNYKLIDSLQSGILLIYFSIQVYLNNIQSTFYDISLTSLFIDITFNLDQFIKFKEKEKSIQEGDIVERPSQEDQMPNIPGGEITFYSSMIVGTVFAMLIAIMMLSELSNNPDLQIFPFNIWMIVLWLVSEFIFMIFIAYYLIPKGRKQDVNGNMKNQLPYYRTKHFLCLMYGLSIGICSLYYSIFIGLYGIYKIIKKIMEDFGWIKKNSQNKVHSVNS